MPTPFNVERPNLAWLTQVDRGVFYGGGHAIVYCANASCGLSAIMMTTTSWRRKRKRRRRRDDDVRWHRDDDV